MMMIVRKYEVIDVDISLINIKPELAGKPLFVSSGRLHTVRWSVWRSSTRGLSSFISELQDLSLVLLRYNPPNQFSITTHHTVRVALSFGPDEIVRLVIAMLCYIYSTYCCSYMLILLVERAATYQRRRNFLVMSSDLLHLGKLALRYY